MTYLGIPGYAIFWFLTAMALSLFCYRIYRLVRYLSLGRKEERFGQKGHRALSTLATLLVHWDQFKYFTPKDRAGITHAIFPMGFLAFAIFYLVFVIIGAGFGVSGTLEATVFFYYYTWIIDLIAPVVIIAALWGIVRRYIAKPPRLKGEQSIEALVILLTVIIIPATYIFKIATDIALGQPPVGLGTALPPISTALSNLFSDISTGSVQAANTALFWGNWAVVLFALVFIAYSRFLHIIASLFNIFFRSPLPRGTLRSIDLEAAESFGAASITDLTWKQMLDLYACVACGKCQEACPATASGKPLNPKNLIQDLKKHLLEVGPKLLKAGGKTGAADYSPTLILPGGVISRDEIWACTTCRACDDICPVYVEHIDKIIDLRRNLVMEQASIPEPAEAALRSIEARGHPWRGSTASRTDWAEGLDIKTLAENSDTDTLLWVGCTGALEERSIRVTRSVAGILKLAGVGFGILGSQESCCGEPARRLGNEYLFQMQAERNIKTLNDYGIKKIVTACPHCYNTLKNEYPGFGGRFEVIHHSQLIARLIQEDRLKITNSTGGVITYHDPCYLGRYNDIFKPPRKIVKSLPGVKLVEMEASGRRSLCCGGGGGRMWQEETIGSRISEMRIEQAIKTGADTIATACPFCLQMFDDAIKARGYEESLKAMDVAELVARSITPEV
ncbi:MAG: heterodisulfide reductase-related iron-sulfur binding cluster [Dehalococcoidales bacterium]|nr:heterodisulfide reductase-related iron-sulfur binding cluster [Dehalococcoidales bacterium]